MKRRITNLALCFIMVFLILPFGSMGAGADTTLISETYTDAALTDADLPGLGWSVVANAGYGTLRLNPSEGDGVVLTETTGGLAHSWKFQAAKTLSADEATTDAYKTRRRVNFKGEYDIIMQMRLFGTINANFRTLMDIGIARLETQNIVLFNPYGSYNATSSPYFNSTAIDYTLRTSMDTNTNTFKTYLSNFGGGQTALGGGSSEKTGLGGFISKVDIRISQAAAANSGYKIKSIQLIEKRNDGDEPTDTAFDALTTDLLTNAPDAVVSHLTLPSAADLELSGVSVEWESGSPEWIDDMGRIIQKPSQPQEIKMSAKITGDADSFTQYADFTFTLSPDARVYTPPKTLLSERYYTWSEDLASMPAADNDAKLAVAKGLGWSIVSSPNGDGEMYYFGGFNMRHNLAPISGAGEGFIAERIMTVNEDGNDSHMKVRRVNFKGIYDVNLMLLMPSDGNGNRYIRFMNGPAAAHEYNITNSFDGSSWSGVSLPTSTATYFKTRLNFIDNKAQLFYNNEETPATHTTHGTDVSLVPGSGYLSSLNFYFDRRLSKSTYIRVNDLTLTEIERVPDPTDDVVKALNTSLLTSAPENVTQALTLPTAADLDVSGVTVTWSSSDPSLIAKTGGIVGIPAEPTPITMTAKITNDADGFTQYADFALTLSDEAVLSDNVIGDIMFEITDVDSVAGTVSGKATVALTAHNEMTRDLMFYAAAYLSGDRLMTVAMDYAAAPNAQTVLFEAELTDVSVSDVDNLKLMLWDEDLRPLTMRSLSSSELNMMIDAYN